VEFVIANKLKEMELSELLSVLIKLKMEDLEAFRKLKEFVEDA
jgi:hypothetical protein